jgi:hypothetical protein
MRAGGPLSVRGDDLDLSELSGDLHQFVQAGGSDAVVISNENAHPNILLEKGVKEVKLFAPHHRCI